MQSLLYVVLSLLLGAMSVWASENLFWMMPPAEISLPEFGITVIAYSIACAVALTAVIRTGIGGMPAAFLGGAVMGYMSEGVIVGTIYQPNPFYLVWTPLAWHALLTGGLILGVGRLAARLGPARMALIWGALGLAGAFWAQYWTSERTDLPDPALFAVYILGFGASVPLTHLVMDRIGQMPRPRGWVLWVAPVIALLYWGLQAVYEMNPYRLMIFPILALLVWVMARLGNGQAPVSLGQPVPVWKHGLFMIAPLLVVVLAPAGWAQGWGTLESNWVVAGLTCLLSVAWLARLIVRALRRKPAAIG